MENTGVIVGRFQVPYLHAGHIHIIETVRNKSDKTIIILGISEEANKKNFFSYNYRKRMILKMFPDTIVHGIMDYPANEQWSLALDGILYVYNKPILYGSRDCFMKNYIGELPCVRIPEIPGVSGTKLREQLRK